MKILRPYQLEAVLYAFEQWKSYRSTLISLPTGTGKTVTAAEIIRRMYPKRTMFLAHRRELIFQAKATIEAHTGLSCGVEMQHLRANDTLFGRESVVISTIQTQSSAKRMEKFDPMEFGLVVADECFPAGTLVDGRPIESISPGEHVRTHFGWGCVTHKFQKSCSRIVVITFLSGRQLICTPNHPVWTFRGFVPSEGLVFGDITLYDKMHNLRGRHSERTQALQSSRMPIRTCAKNNRGDVLEAWRTDNKVSEKKWNVFLSRTPNGIFTTQSNGVETYRSRREWDRPDSAAKTIIDSDWFTNGSGDCNEHSKRVRVSTLLQSGHRGRASEDCNRGGRALSRLPVEKRSRSEESHVFGVDRVESVAFFQSGGDGEFDRLCPDGVVYNLEVSNGNTYFANGYLVHNCHHAPADSWRRVIGHYQKNPDTKLLGLTATPDRADEIALGTMFESVAYDYEILDAIRQGYLVDIEQFRVFLGDLDLSKVRTTAGDLNHVDLANVLESEGNVHGMAHAILEKCADKKTLVFTESVHQSELICSILNAKKAGCAVWASGKTEDEERARILQRFAAGDVQFAVNCALWTEGFDLPSIEAIALCKPTKSRALQAQMIGRGLRPLPGTVEELGSDSERRCEIGASAKRSCLILDFVGNCGRHQLVSPADILGGRILPEVLERAKVILNKGGGSAVGAIKAARQQLDQEEKDRLEEQARQKKAEEERIAQAIKRREEQERKRQEKLMEVRQRMNIRCDYKAVKVDAFSAVGLERSNPRGWDAGKTLTPKQRMILKKGGVDASKLSYSDARAMIGEIMARWDSGLCSVPQAKLLTRYGYDARTITRVQARILIDKLKANGWKRLEVQ